MGACIVIARIIHGDARAELERIYGGMPAAEAERTVIITDPVWPNCPPELLERFGCADPEATLTRLLEVAHARRVIIWLGVNSDPRFLRAVPARWPFIRVCWLRYVIPSYQGTVLNSGTVAYVYGSPERPEGARCAPGECSDAGARWNEVDGEHPSPRKIEHALWLVRWFTRPGDTVIDPFAGSGTTGVAAMRLGRDFIGIEHDRDFAELARSRLVAEAEHSTTAAMLSGQERLFR
jgi:hypothetical protein